MTITPQSPEPAGEYGGWVRPAAMTTSAGELSHVWHAQDADGRDGIVKVPRDSRPTTIDRFQHEVRGMAGLRTEPGVLPLLDFDPSPNPGWMVTKPAQQLARHFHQMPRLPEASSQRAPERMTDFLEMKG
jgi:hypothetical protein